MTNRSTFILATFGFLLVLLSCACDPCDDPGTIEIDYSDRSAPDLYWQIVTRTTTPSGPISAITLVSDPNSSIGITSNDVVEVTLFGEDNQSGMKWLNLQGGFGYLCSAADGAIALDGIIPGNRIFFDLAEGECAVAEAEYPVFVVDGSSLCPGNFPGLSNGGYELLGSGANSNDYIRQNFRLLINILDSGI
ncbi:hypothetical protein FUA23_19865 [Neolewinella aurantiaca]|uniref:Uncharacterized protein n=1 Tax=Neolewinella aurantiaca TaxID=2602767 RepID=A0A5C7FMK9_9BACT|nr:hypothetical protein [Neolewinella aurantiaca]TXF85995.1 hypothetical protein FUA23_19865 [Neolewinella aurantiaca]